MNKFIVILLIAASALMQLPVRAQAPSHSATIGTLRQKLSGIRSAKDSLKVLYDILDLSSRKDYPALVDEMFGVAKRADDTKARLDLCRQVSAALPEDSQLAEVEDEVRRIPASEEQRETELFIKMKRVSNSSRYLSEEDRQKEITKLIDKFELKTPQDKYERVLDLFTLVGHLRTEATGEMLKSYLDRLYTLTNSQDFSLYAIPNIVYSETANIYSDAGEAKKAVNADRKLLEVIAGLEKKYAKMGRKYRNYDISRFVCYRRMLRNYSALAPGEAEQLYRKILDISKRNENVANDLKNNPRTYAFYYMAVGDYNSAIPYLKKCLDENDALMMRRQIYGNLVKAAEQTGDNETHLLALTQYNKILEELNALRATARYKELQIKYDVKQLQERNAALELEQRLEEAEAAQDLMSLLLVAFAILLAALVFSLFQWRRFKKNAFQMGSVVDSLRKERDKMHDDIYHDYAEKRRTEPEEKHRDWKSQISLFRAGGENVSKLMNDSILNDLISIAIMGGANRLKFIQEVSVDRLMREAVVKATENADEPELFNVEYPEDDFEIVTDHECLCDILAHLFETSHKLTGEHGKIEITFARGEGHTDFIVTCAGHIASIKDERDIFSSLLVTEDIVEQAKNGMYICRLITLMLDSLLRQDKTYKAGTRFIYSVPDNLLTSTHQNPCLAQTVNATR